MLLSLAAAVSFGASARSITCSHMPSPFLWDHGILGVGAWCAVCAGAGRAMYSVIDSSSDLYKASLGLPTGGAECNG